MVESKASSELDQRLRANLTRKWCVNRTFMRERDFEALIDHMFCEEDFQERLTRRINLYADPKGRDVLDIGSGEGRLVVALNLPGAQAFGVNIISRTISAYRV